MNKTARLLQSWVFVVCITVFSTGLSYAEKGKILTGEELKQMLSKEVHMAGWSTRGGRYMDVYSTDGNVKALVFANDLVIEGNRGQELQGKGTWKIENDQVCLDIQDTVIGGDLLPKGYGHESRTGLCYKWRQLGEKFEWWEATGMAEGFFYVLGD